MSHVQGRAQSCRCKGMVGVDKARFGGVAWSRTVHAVPLSHVQQYSMAKGGEDVKPFIIAPMNLNCRQRREGASHSNGWSSHFDCVL